MSRIVLRDDRTEELRQTLALGRGSGRVKALLSLTSGPRTLSDLARNIGADAPYATLIVNELSALGLVSRSHDDQDRRRKFVELTNQGRAAATRAQKILDRPPPALRELPHEELTELARILQGVAREHRGG